MAYSVEQIKGVIGSQGGLARRNLYAVQLPPLPGAAYSASALNMLTSSVQLPPRQITTLERNINGYITQVGNGSRTSDIMMTFQVTNSMMVKEYFESWMNLIWNTKSRRVGYLRDYAKRVQIKVLSLPKYNTSFKIPGIDKLPFRGSMPDVSLGPVNLSLATGGLSLDFGQNTIQTITLENAYPMTLNDVQMGDAEEGFMEIAISFTYSEWYTTPGLGNKLSGIIQL